MKLVFLIVHLFSIQTRKQNIDPEEKEEETNEITVDRVTDVLLLVLNQNEMMKIDF